MTPLFFREDGGAGEAWGVGRVADGDGWDTCGARLTIFLLLIHRGEGGDKE